MRIRICNCPKEPAKVSGFFLVALMFHAHKNRKTGYTLAGYTLLRVLIFLYKYNFMPYVQV